MPLPRRRSCVEGIISGMPLLILRRDLVPGRTLAEPAGLPRTVADTRVWISSEEPVPHERQ